MLSKYNEQELLKLTRFNAFTHHLITDLLKNSKDKINISNSAKALFVLRTTREELDNLNKIQIIPQLIELRKNKGNADDQLDRLCKRLSNDLNDLLGDAVSNFKTTSNRKISFNIDQDISNDEFKSKLESIIKSEINELKSKIEKNLELRMVKLEKDIDNILKDYQNQCQLISSSFNQNKTNVFDIKFTPCFNPGNGISGSGIFGSIAGIAMLIWNPAGWVGAIIGGLTVILSFVKSVWGFFSSDYKKGQQRNSAASNIHTVCEKIKTSFDKIILQTESKVDDKIKDIKKILHHPIESLETISTGLEEGSQKLKNLECELSAKSKKKE